MVFFQAVRIRIGQIDKIRGVKRHNDARSGGIGSDLAGSLLSHMDALAALVLIGVQPNGAKPRRSLGRGFADRFGIGLRIAGHAEDRAHRHLLIPAEKPERGLNAIANGAKDIIDGQRVHKDAVHPRTVAAQNIGEDLVTHDSALPAGAPQRAMAF